MPAPPARSRSASVPCGTSSTSSSPERYWRANSLFSPTYEPVTRAMRPAARRTPRPRPSTPQLFETTRRPPAPCACRARMRTSGTPPRPKPPTASDAPSTPSRRSRRGGVDRVDADAARAEFQGGGPRQAAQRPLAGRVGDRVVRGEGRGGADVDDGRAGRHERGEVLDAEERAGDVDGVDACHVPGRTSPIRARQVMPALSTRPCTRPYDSLSSAASAAHCSSLVTSSWRQPGASLTSVAMTRAPPG